MNSRVIEGIRLIRVPDGFEHQKPIFQEPAENVGETWTHGSMVGGLCWLTQQADIARSYRCAADTLIEKSLDDRLSWEIVYPVIFLYRHAIEITLKALFPDSKPNHNLVEMIEQAHGRIRAALPAYEADWVKARLLEFSTIDPQSTAFRFAGAKLNGGVRNDGEWWIDFHHLRQTMSIILQLLEVMAWDSPVKEERE